MSLHRVHAKSYALASMTGATFSILWRSIWIGIFPPDLAQLDGVYERKISEQEQDYMRSQTCSPCRIRVSNSGKRVRSIGLPKKPSNPDSLTTSISLT